MENVTFDLVDTWFTACGEEPPEEEGEGGGARLVHWRQALRMGWAAVLRCAAACPRVTDDDLNRFIKARRLLPLCGGGGAASCEAAVHQSPVC